MKFAFSSLIAPEWDLATAIARAKEYGYDGLAIDALPPQPDSVRPLLAQSGVRIACVRARAAGDANGDGPPLVELVRGAAQLGAAIVRLPAPAVAKGQHPGQVARRFAEEIAPAADAAAAAGMMLAIENTPPFATAHELWTLLETIDHPAIGACYNARGAGLAGEKPSLGVPTLNARIRLVRIDLEMLNLKPEGAASQSQGANDQSQVPSGLLRRLRGIGYAGWVSVDREGATAPNVVSPSEVLPAALALLRNWIKPPTAPAKQAAGHRQPA